jgi:hypothetical protein
LALQIIERVRAEKGEVRPRYFRPRLSAALTESERYTADILQRMCDTAFGSRIEQKIPSRHRIWNANADWIRHHIPLGKGVGFDELVGLAALYTEHIHEDIAP